MAEAIAMKQGLALANRLGCTRIQAESDSLDTIDACTGEDYWWSEASAVYANCVDISIAIGSVSFKHCPREVNKVARDS
jgi:hypothetical protein